MMDEDKKELRKILNSFARKPPDFDVFVLKLLDIKAWHQADKSRTHQVLNTALEPLSPKQALDAVSALYKALNEAEMLFRALNAGTMPLFNAPKAHVDCTTNEIRISRIADDKYVSAEGRNIATDLAPEILKWLKGETEKVAMQLVQGQKRPRRIKEFDLWLLAITCQDAGITCTSSEDTPFHRLASWLLGQGDHKRTIKKIIEKYPYLKDKKDKVPRT